MADMGTVNDTLCSNLAENQFGRRTLDKNGGVDPAVFPAVGDMQLGA
jgi:hypothetical protein